MANSRIARRYAVALHDSAVEAGTDERVQQDMISIHNILQSSKELRIVVKSPVIQHWKKKAAFKEIFENSVSPMTAKFIDLLTDKGRESSLEQIVTVYNDLYNEQKGLLPVQVSTAVEMDADLREKLIKNLEARTGKKILPTFTVNPDLKGGVVLQVNDLVMDGSLRHQLEKMYEEMIA
jgi:F-type H+-transporting ATPase subunit delta